MDRVEESALLDFCVAQKERFRVDEWLSRSGQRDRLSLVAYLLASSPWYGNGDELRKVSRILDPSLIGNASAAVSRLNFDCSRFCHMLRARLEHARPA